MFWIPVVIAIGPILGGVESLMFALAVAPSVALLPLCLGTYLGGVLERDPDYREPARRLGWGIAWRIFAFATIWSGVGYLVMVSIALIASISRM